MTDFQYPSEDALKEYLRRWMDERTLLPRSEVVRWHPERPVGELFPTPRLPDAEGKGTESPITVSRLEVTRQYPSLADPELAASLREATARYTERAIQRLEWLTTYHFLLACGFEPLTALRALWVLLPWLQEWARNVLEAKESL